jgi:hypothetical protein
LEDLEMRSPLFLGSLLAASVAVALVQIACGGDDSAPAAKGTPTPTVQDSGGFSLSDAESGTTVTITGAGTVYTGGPFAKSNLAVNCTSDGTTTTGNCKAEYQDTLYAVAAPGWSFSHWDPGSISGSTYYVGPVTPALTAVFVTDTTAVVPDAAPPPPVDAGHDTGTADTGTDAPADTGPADTGSPDTGADTGHD